MPFGKNYAHVPVRLIDFDRITNNSFWLVNQFSIRNRETKRPDVVMFVNGLTIDKTGWKKYRFGDVAIQTKEIVDMDNTELTRYVAGEHMNSEDIHIRRWGTVGDGYLGPAFIRRFHKGDILYGSRRTYLKKGIPHLASLWTGDQPYHLRYCPYEHAAARLRGVQYCAWEYA